MGMEVIILAGGLGTRLRSVVSEVPKCMAPVSGKPFLWYLLKYLTRFNVTRVVLSVGYLREVIFKWIDEVKDDFPFEFDYAIEETPLGTGGGIRLAMSKIHGSEAVVLNGDTFFDVDIDSLLEAHRSQPWAEITLALKQMRNFDRYGTVEVDTDGRIIKFNEKRQCEEGLINGGVYVLNNTASMFEGLPQKFSFETEVLQARCGTAGTLYGTVHNGYFIDIGVPEDYRKAEEIVEVINDNLKKKS